MSKRLLIALPVAAVVVIGLFWAMKGLVPVGRPVADYTVRVDLRTLEVSLPEDEPKIYTHDPIHVEPERKRLPRPLPVGPGEPQPIPREPMAPPEVEPPYELDPERLPSKDDPDEPCTPTGRPIIRMSTSPPSGIRDGDYVIVEFTLGADGVPRDVEVVESSNPKLDDYAVRSAERWRYKSDCEDGKLVETEPTRVRVRIEFEEEE